MDETSATGSRNLELGRSTAASAIEAIFSTGSLTGLTDAELLERFAAMAHSEGRNRRSRAVAEAAFTALVERHGPLVFGTCRGILGNRHDSEDAFQATFLVLARKARSIRHGDAISGWLHEVARRIALRLRHRTDRRRQEELRLRDHALVSDLIELEPPSHRSCPELHEELDRIPEPFRSAILLCDLEGESYERAAARLGCPLGTLQSRLTRGRRRLRARLERRGVDPTVMLMGAGSKLREAIHRVPARLSEATIQSAIGQALSTGSAAIAAMVVLELKRHAVVRSLILASALLATGIALMGAVSFARSGVDPVPPDPDVHSSKIQALAQKTDSTPKPALTPQSEPLPHIGPAYILVKDDRGKPVANAVVRAIARDGQELQSFTSNQEGIVVIPREEVGYGLRFVRHEDNTVGWIDATPLTRTVPQPSRTTGTKENPAIITLVPLNHRVNGTVVDPDKKLIPGVSIRPIRLGSIEELQKDFSEPEFPAEMIAPAVTDNEGRFSITLPAGVAALLNVKDARWLGMGAVVKPTNLMISPKSITAKPRGRITGRVIDEATGQAIPGVEVEAHPAEHHNDNENPEDLASYRRGMEPDAARILLMLDVERYSWLMLSRGTTTDTDGRFAINSLTPGVYTVLLKSIPGRPTDTALAVEARRVLPLVDTNVDLTVIPGRPLRGTVIDGMTGKPIAGVPVGCRGPAAPPDMGDIPLSKTDANGRFVFHVPPGEHFVELRDGGKYSRLGHATVTVAEQGETPPIRLTRLVRVVNAFREEARHEAASQGSWPVLLNSREVTGYVRDQQGKPVPGVKISPIPKNETILGFDTAVTDQLGRFQLTRIPERNLTVKLEKVGFKGTRELIGSKAIKLEWTYDLFRDARLAHHTAPSSDDPISPESRDRLTFVDPLAKSTDLLADGPGGAGDDFNRLARGIRKLGKTYFRIGEGMIRLDPQGTHALPRKVEGITVRARANRLHLLHATQSEATLGSGILNYDVHYLDGSSERIPIVFGRDIAGWRAGTDPDNTAPAPSNATVAWTGLNDQIDPATKEGPFAEAAAIRLIAKTWTNPHPERPIASISVRLDETAKVNAFLVAATLERDE